MHMILQNKKIAALLSAAIMMPIASKGEEQEWVYSYTSLGQLQRADGPRTDVEDVTTYQYTEGRLQSITNAEGHVTRVLAHNNDGEPTQIEDPNGLIIEYTYTDRGWLETLRVKADTGDQVTAYEYNPIGMVTRITQPNGAYLAFSYDEARRLTAIVNNLNERIAYELDNAGNIISETVYSADQSIVRSISRAFDELSRLQTVSGNHGQQVNYDYDKVDKLIASTDGKSHTTQQGYDALSRLTTVTDPDSHTIGYTYDQLSRLVAVKDQRNLMTEYRYDAFDNLLTLTSPDTGTTTYTYDSAGNRTSSIDARGVEKQFTYDALNRLTHIHFPEDASEDVYFTYDEVAAGNHGVGQLTSFSNDSGSTQLHYQQGQLTRVTHAMDEQVFQLDYQYDSAGQLNAIIYPSGLKIVYTRDALGRVNQVDQTLSQQTTPLVSQASYQPFGALDHLSYGNDLSQQVTYDTDGRMTQYTLSKVDQTLSSTDLAYDLNNNIDQISHGLSPETDQQFAYDALDRLTQASGVYGSMSYTYDPVGNRLNKQVEHSAVSLIKTYLYATDSNQLLTISGFEGEEERYQTLSYTQAGHTASKQLDQHQMHFEYNQANRLKAVWEKQ